jgi:hypothetical protein
MKKLMMLFCLLLAPFTLAQPERDARPIDQPADPSTRSNPRATYERTIRGSEDPQLIDIDSMLNIFASVHLGIEERGAPGYIAVLMSETMGLDSPSEAAVDDFRAALQDVRSRYASSQVESIRSVCNTKDTITRDSNTLLSEMDIAASRYQQELRDYARTRISEAVGARNFNSLRLWIEREMVNTTTHQQIDVTVFLRDQGVDAATMLDNFCAEL